MSIELHPWRRIHSLPGGTGLVRQQQVCREELPACGGEVERRAGAGLDPAGVDAGRAQEALDDGHVAALRGVVQGRPSLGVGQVDVDIRAAAELRENQGSYNLRYNFPSLVLGTLQGDLSMVGKKTQPPNMGCFAVLQGQ